MEIVLAAPSAHNESNYTKFEYNPPQNAMLWHVQRQFKTHQTITQRSYKYSLLFLICFDSAGRQIETNQTIHQASSDRWFALVLICVDLAGRARPAKSTQIKQSTKYPIRYMVDCSLVCKNQGPCDRLSSSPS